MDAQKTTTSKSTSTEPTTEKPSRTSTIAESLQAIVDKEGKVTPERIVALASKPAHPLHSYFEWDDTKAAQAHRLAEAYRMMRLWTQVRTYKNSAKPTLVETVKVRALLPAGNRDLPYGMLPRDTALGLKEARKKFVSSKWAELRSWCNEVHGVKEFDEIRMYIQARLPKAPERG